MRQSTNPAATRAIKFRVTNSHGEGVHAALGLQVVDEAVFALAEKQPGFAKVFFYLEQEVMKPRYEIHSIGMPEMVEPAGAVAGRTARPRRAGVVLGYRNGEVRIRFETEFGRDCADDEVPASMPRRYQTRFWRKCEPYGRRS